MYTVDQGSNMLEVSIIIEYAICNNKNCVGLTPLNKFSFLKSMCVRV